MTITLNAEERGDKKPNQVRAEQKVTAELYGPDSGNQHVAMNYNEFEKAYEEAGSSSLVDIKSPDGNTYPVLIKDVMRHHITGKYINADLHQVSMTEKIEAEAELEFVGEAPAVKELGGVFAPARSTLYIKALPRDLVSSIEVDISILKTFEDKITVEDIKLPEGVEPAEEADITLASVSEPREEEEEAPVSEEDAVAGVEVVDEKKEDGEDGEEKKEE